MPPGLARLAGLAGLAGLARLAGLDRPDSGRWGSGRSSRRRFAGTGHAGGEDAPRRRDPDPLDSAGLEPGLVLAPAVRGAPRGVE
jgi:hypothetical protein